MPTEDANLARVLKALLSVGDVKLEEVQVVFQTGYRLTANSSVVLDGEHARAVRDACKIAIIEDPANATDPTRCGCRETMQEYLVQGCELHDPNLQ